MAPARRHQHRRRLHGRHHPQRHLPRGLHRPDRARRDRPGRLRPRRRRRGRAGPPAHVLGGETLLKTFWENHDSTHLNRHGNDIGTQYRSAVWTTTPAQETAAHEVRDLFQGELTRLGLGTCVTTIDPADSLYSEFGGPFYLAEDYHQGYLEKNPDGYCNHGPNGVTCPVGVANLPAQTDVLAPEDAPEV